MKSLIIHIPEMDDIPRLWEQTEKEKNIISEYKSSRTIVTIMVDCMIVIPFFIFFRINVLKDFNAFLFLVLNCMVFCLPINNYVYQVYCRIIDQNKLNITEKWKSGSEKQMLVVLSDKLLKLYPNINITDCKIISVIPKNQGYTLFLSIKE